MAGVGELVRREEREARRDGLERLADVRDERRRRAVDVDVVIGAERAAQVGAELLGREPRAERREVDDVVARVARGDRVVEQLAERRRIGREDHERTAEVVRLRGTGQTTASDTGDRRCPWLVFVYVTTVNSGVEWFVLSICWTPTLTMSQPSFHNVLTVGGVSSDVGTQRFGDALVSRYVKKIVIGV